jgi:hypothetical protein
MQLDLFNESTETTAFVYFFPLARRVRLVRDTAAALACRDYRHGQRFWSAHIGKIRASLERSGAEASAIENEIHSYSSAVSRVLHLQEQFGRPDDAT